MLSRRTPLIGLVALLVLSVLLAPAVRAQSAALYFPSTGHHLYDDSGFLSFWQAHSGELLLGFPISEAFEANGQQVQYFERGRLEQIVDPAGGTATVQTGRIGTEYAEALWRMFAPASNVSSSQGQFFETTGHSLREPFLSFWKANGGLDFFGAPISEPLWETTERGLRRVQFFERGQLERDPALAGMPGEVVVGSLGRALALLRGVDLTPIPNQGVEEFGPPAPLAPQVASLDIPPTPVPTAVPTAVPAPASAPAKPAARSTKPAKPAAAVAEPARKYSAGAAGKYILVDLSAQWLYAFEDGEQVFDAPVATGRDGMETPAGKFSIYAKLKVQTMDGVTDGKAWVVPNVPNVMYINGGVALHGTYWHNLFGSGVRPSHGCINLPLKSAAWLYNWAPVGTPVNVHY